MNRMTISAIVVGLSLMAVPSMSSASLNPETLVTGVIEQVYDEEGRLLYEIGIEPTNPLLGFVKHYLHVGVAKDAAKPGGGGGGSNDCTATGYRNNGYFWTQPYSGYASSYASQMNTAGNTWDAETGASIFGGISSGSRGTAGDQDFVNQIDWVNLGASSTIAVTTTWYYRGSGEAVESDGEYNTYYAWSTSGDANAMDVLNIATHEVGHTFGLGHPGSGSCLTMYAYASEGETQKRTLGVGDIRGIEAIYGA